MTSGSDDGTRWSESNVSSGVEVTVSRDGTHVRYELSLSPSADVDRLWVVVGGADVETATEFERTFDRRRTRLEWTGSERATVELVVDAGRPDGGGESVATDEWTFTPVPFVEVQRAENGTITRSWPLTDRANASGESGVFGDRYALAGSTDVVTRSTSGGRVRVVVPSGASPRERPTAVAEALVTASSRLNVGDDDGSVLAFAVPGVRRGGESVPARDEFWVDADASLDSPRNVWLHEYVHTRQTFDLARDMRWFREASAAYYAARLGYVADHIDRQAMRTHLDGEPSTATLTVPSTWEHRRVPERKGARTLAVLDRKIRTETDGHRSLQDVFRRLNAHDGTVTYAVFAQTVGEVAGRPMDDWLDRHVAGPAPVADSYSGPGRLVATATATVDDVRTTYPTATALLLSSTAFSFVAAVPLYVALGRVDDWTAVHVGERSPYPR